MHSHALPSIYDKKLFQVTGYGDDGVGDENDVWILEISGGKTGDVVTPMTSLTLRHKHLHCMLTDTAENLPKEWSFMLSEIGCSPWQRRTKENRGFYVSLHFPKIFLFLFRHSIICRISHASSLFINLPGNVYHNYLHTILST